MSEENQLQKEIEKLARKMSRERHGSEALWELYMHDATKQKLQEIKRRSGKRPLEKNELAES